MGRPELFHLYLLWRNKNGNGRDKNDQRFGQWVMNRFNISGYPEIFYEEKAYEAFKMLYNGVLSE